MNGLIAISSGSRAGLLLLGGVVIVTAILLKRSYRYFGSRTRRRNQNIVEHLREHLNIDVEQHDASARIDRQEVELHALYRECAGKLDSKIVALEQVLQRSEEVANRLDAALEALRDEAAKRS